jgi:FkbM family methyltransferase
MLSLRQEYLKKLDEKCKKLRKFSKYIGPGFRNKILRLFFTPDLYLPYLFWKFILHFKGTNKLQLFWGKKIRFQKAMRDVNFLWILPFKILPGEQEWKLTKFFIKNLKKDDIFYDVGANWGFYTYLALEFCKEIHVFEPLPFIFSELSFNLKNVNNVFLNEVALSDRNGKTYIYLSKSEKGFLKSELSSIIKENLEPHSSLFERNKKILVKTITLDKYLESHNKPTVLKLDVEGAEGLIIEGGKSFFKNNAPIIAMEVWAKNYGGEISMRAVEKLVGLGYQAYFINPDGEVEKVDKDLSEIVQQNNLEADNFIFKKEA